MQARLGVPMLVMVEGSTPALLLAGPLGHTKLEPWRGIVHSSNVVLAVMLSRFAIFDIVAVRTALALDFAAAAANPLSITFGAFVPNW